MILTWRSYFHYTYVFKKIQFKMRLLKHKSGGLKYNITYLFNNMRLGGHKLNMYGNIPNLNWSWTNELSNRNFFKFSMCIQVLSSFYDRQQDLTRYIAAILILNFIFIKSHLVIKTTQFPSPTIEIVRFRYL